MTDRDEHLYDLQATADRLRAERPEATAHELDRVLLRVRAGARDRRAGGFWRSRAAVVATLVLGMLLSTSGASLAISGFASSSGNASQAQYGTQDEGDVLGDDESGGPAEPGRPGTTRDDEVQETRQIEAGAQGGGEELPFTGFAAIPIWSPASRCSRAGCCCGATPRARHKWTVHPPSRWSSGAAAGLRLRPGDPAAPTGDRLRLLPSGPDLVHGPASRGTRPSTPPIGALARGPAPREGIRPR